MLVLGQKLWRRLPALLCAAVSLPGVVLNVHATTVIAPRFDTLVDRAELIFTGQVTGQRSEWRNNEGKKSIVTLVTFAVRQLHKGRADSGVTLQFLGGTVGDAVLDVADMPKFKPGERVVLFIEGNGLAASPVIGFFHGKFSLRQDENGRDAVLTHSGEPLRDVAEIGRAKQLLTSQPSRRALSHEEFSTKIRERLAGQK